MELRENIKLEIVKILFTIQLVDEEEERRQMEELKQNMQKEVQNIEIKSEDEEKFEKKVARNEPCPCGSGKKYKQCCGKSGPKKGLLAK
jgi:preprotein translocase subunit SecA